MKDGVGKDSVGGSDNSSSRIWRVGVQQVPVATMAAVERARAAAKTAKESLARTRKRVA